MAARTPGDLGRLRRTTVQRVPYSTRPFYLVLLGVVVLTLYSFAAKEGDLFRRANARSAGLRRGVIVTGELECRHVHHVQDQCAFIQANCPDEDSGIFSYLRLYYCRLPQAKPVAFTIIAMWLGLLFSTIGIAASDFLCVNLATIADILGMSDNLAGVTFLAFGNGSPDIFSTFAAFSTNSGSLAVGELIGAASFITAVVAGSIAFIRPFKVPRRPFVRDVSFFIVAASFSLVFLYDGKLQLWECAVLVGLYVFYVIFVLTWHWYFHRRMIKRRKEAAAREHFIVPGSDEAELGEEYHDEDESITHDVRARPSVHRGPSIEELLALERGDAEEEDDELEEQREEVARAEISRKMRLSRPRAKSRALTRASIRPSLVGALEFHAVLSDLQRARNITTMPIHMRRYSDDPRMIQDDQRSSHSEPHVQVPLSAAGSSDQYLSVNRPKDQLSRNRAVSASEAENLGSDRTILPYGVPKVDLLGAVPEDESSLWRSRRPVAPSPTISISPSPVADGSGGDDVASRNGDISVDRLAPPNRFAISQSAKSQTGKAPEESAQLPGQTPFDLFSKSPNIRQYSDQSISPGASPAADFPPYRDDPRQISPRGSRAPSISLPDSRVSPSIQIPTDFYFGEMNQKPLKWWPYVVLPGPHELFCTLFPTIDNWREKNLFQKFVGLAMVPSVFLLKITLPVVEAERESDVDDIPDLSLPPATSSADPKAAARSQSFAQFSIDEVANSGESIGAASFSAGSVHHPNTNGLPPQQGPGQTIVQSPEQLPVRPTDDDNKNWSRWLVILQLFTAPLFVVLIVWANMNGEHPKALFKPTLISLLSSLGAILFILLTTSADRAPKWRLLLCFVGFAVSISWISTIANEVVGVLKTLGVVLNISDAILGLTIFAVGNSCGDLVANITVGKLGFPNMALSACFGGPMLNILLGIGLSGMYLSIRGARERAHDGKKMKFEPYHIEISKTLLISGATLLITLLALLTIVPLRRWKMDRIVGWILVIFWTLSTVANVVVELLGVRAKPSS